MSTKYKLNLRMDEATAGQLEPGTRLRVTDQSGREVYLEVGQRTNLSSVGGAVSSDLGSFWKGFRLPLADRSSRRRLGAIYLTYAFLRAGGLSSFFVRGWRVAIIRRMTGADPAVGLAPPVRKLRDIGRYVDDGVKMISLNMLFKLPSILIMVIVGFSNMELLLSALENFVGLLFGGESAQPWGKFFSESSFNWSLSLGTQLLLLAGFSLVVTPAIKIMEMRYALGYLKYRDFFRWEEIKRAFLLHRKYKFKTIPVYLWDVLLTGVSFVVGLLMTMLPLFLLVVYPAYKLVFNHWPKYYAYGSLARRMQLNGDLPPARPGVAPPARTAPSQHLEPGHPPIEETDTEDRYLL